MSIDFTAELETENGRIILQANGHRIVMAIMCQSRLEKLLLRMSLTVKAKC